MKHIKYLDWKLHLSFLLDSLEADKLRFDRKKNIVILIPYKPISANEIVLFAI